MDKNKFQSIPEQALATLSNTLEELWLSVNLIETIMPESLPLPQLKSLSLDVNKVFFDLCIKILDTKNPNGSI